MFVLLIFITMSVWAGGKSKVVPVHPVSYDGTPIDIEHAPFTAAYVIVIGTGAKKCSAIILNKRFILTAAHCFVARTASDSIKHSIQVGTDDVFKGERYEIEETFVHPHYVSGTLDNDVGLIKLSRNLRFSRKVQPITMAEPGLVIPPGAMVEAFGYGVDYSDIKHRNILREIKIPHIESEVCQSYFKKHDANITDRMICAGSNEQYSCHGDSGGPLVYNNVVVGVASFVRLGAEQCCMFPAVFARVSELREFIDTTIAANT